MKKNDYLLLAATALYSFLFFRQNAGINFLLFNVFVITILLIRNIKLLQNNKWLWAAGMCIISSVCVFVNSSALSIIANISSLILLSAFSFNVYTSSIFSFLFGCFSIASSILFIIIDSIKRFKSDASVNTSSKSYKLISVVLVLFISILFFNMYKSSNPLFAENTKWVNFDFVSVDWIFFTVLGFILMYGLINHNSIKQIEIWENKLPQNTLPFIVNENLLNRVEAERFSGVLLFGLLNIMLIILNFGDIKTLYFNGGLPKNVTHSDFVHSGVGITILSIIIATCLIMFLHRKKFTDIKYNNLLLIGIYAWIAQNLLMLSSTFLRNQIYVHEYNYTYKRVGVYVWLVLAAVGLCIMFWKIYKNKSNWYLIKTNFAFWFSILTLCACVNWDKQITQFNIANKPLAQVDFNYLFSLSDANIPNLVAITTHPEFKDVNSIMEKRRENISDSNRAETFSQLLNKKINHFLEDYTNDWRSFDLRDREIVNSIK